MTDTIKHNFYVDDCLKSMPSEAEAMALVRDLSAVCQFGGFQLVKWISNSRYMLESIAVEKRAMEVKELDFDRDNLLLREHWDYSGVQKLILSGSRCPSKKDLSQDGVCCLL